MAKAKVGQLADALTGAVAALPTGTRFALIGGLAVAARSTPRFTADVDLAVSVADDDAAEAVTRAMIGRGHHVKATLENTKHGRLGTVRLQAGGSGPVVDLLFAACGIEPEIVRDASLERVLELELPLARTGHLIAMKLVARDDERRPDDRRDLLELSKVADDAEWTRAAELAAWRGRRDPS